MPVGRDFCALVLLVICAAAAHGQDYPGSRPLRIVTSAAGSSSDVTARIVVDRLPAVFGARAIVDNRGILAPEIAAKAPPDGYTVLFYGPPAWISPLMRNTAQWDPIRDFAPVTLGVNTPNVLVVHPSLPVKSVKELIALARAKPGELNYGSGSSGSSTHLGAELFNSMARVNIVRVPYRGTGPALLGLLGGHVQLMFPAGAAAVPYMKSGTLRALAVASAKPSALMPELPTIASAGMPGFEADTPMGVFLPAAAPPKVVERLNQIVVGVLNLPDVKKLVFAQGSEVVGSSPSELAAAVKAEMARWGRLIREKGLRED